MPLPEHDAVLAAVLRVEARAHAATRIDSEQVRDRMVQDYRSQGHGALALSKGDAPRALAPVTPVTPGARTDAETRIDSERVRDHMVQDYRSRGHGALALSKTRLDAAPRADAPPAPATRPAALVTRLDRSATRVPSAAPGARHQTRTASFTDVVDQDRERMIAELRAPSASGLRKGYDHE